jgi:hypothetical protein
MRQSLPPNEEPVRQALKVQPLRRVVRCGFRVATCARARWTVHGVGVEPCVGEEAVGKEVAAEHAGLLRAEGAGAPPAFPADAMGSSAVHPAIEARSTGHSQVFDPAQNEVDHGKATERGRAFLADANRICSTQIVQPSFQPMRRFGPRRSAAVPPTWTARREARPTAKIAPVSQAPALPPP